MRIGFLVIASLATSSFGLVNPQPSFSRDRIAQLDLENVSEVTTSVLDRLGYDCNTVADVGIVCKKCSSENVLTEKCNTYICDAVTKKCRQENATIPKLPSSDNEENETEIDNLPIRDR